MYVLILTGFLSGIISGMGIGGGAILIPALYLISDINQKTVQGINLVYFIPTAICACVVHLKNTNIELKQSLVIGSFGICGALLGVFFASVLNDGALRRIFGVFLALVGLYEIFTVFKEEFYKKKKG